MKWIVAIVVVIAVLGGWIWLQAGKESFDVRRANVTGAVNALSVARDAVDGEFARTHALPAPREFPVADKHLRAINLETGGRLVATLSYPDWAEGDGRHVVYEARVAGSTLEWRCHSPDLEKKYLPAACR